LKPTAVLFSGQGAQHIGMGEDLFEASHTVQDMYKRADTLLKFDLTKTSFEGPVEKLTKTDYCQPALYLHGLALLKTLQHKLPDFTFTASAGLSLGEFTAHAAASTFTFEDGLKLVATRGKLMREACEASEGGMVSLIGCSHEQALKVALETDLEIANYNCPGQVVLSGEKRLIPKAIDVAKRIGLKKAVPLNVAGAYHSSLMHPAQEKFKSSVENTKMSEPQVVVISNVTGQIVKEEKIIKETLIKQVTGSVRWEACIHTLLGLGTEQFIELGPGKILMGLCRRIDKNITCFTAGNLEELEAVIDEIK
jgi:[acyl-carrier-protein] S-malonyltransferase